MFRVISIEYVLEERHIERLVPLDFIFNLMFLSHLLYFRIIFYNEQKSIYLHAFCILLIRCQTFAHSRSGRLRQTATLVIPPNGRVFDLFLASKSSVF